MKYLYWAPRILGIIGVLYISMFALDVFAPGTPLGEALVGLAIHLLPSAVLALMLAAAWRYERTGGLVFVVVSFAPFIFLSNPAWVNALLGGPFLLVGLLFLIHAYYAMKRTTDIHG
jgi:hypothetical protein